MYLNPQLVFYYCRFEELNKTTSCIKISCDYLIIPQIRVNRKPDYEN